LNKPFDDCLIKSSFLIWWRKSNTYFPNLFQSNYGFPQKGKSFSMFLFIGGSKELSSSGKANH